MTSHLIITTLVSVVPTMVLIWYFGSKSAFEPPKYLATAFCLGIVVVVPVALCAYPFRLILDEAGVLQQVLLRAFVSAGLIEEGAKFALLYFVFYRRVGFRHPVSALIYGATLALGFATIENLLYVADEGLKAALLRAWTAVPCHAFLGAISGYYLSRYALLKRRSEFWKALWIPVVLHGLYNLPLMAGTYSTDVGGGTIILALFVLFLMGTWSHMNLIHMRPGSDRFTMKTTYVAIFRVIMGVSLMTSGLYVMGSASITLLGLVVSETRADYLQKGIVLLGVVPCVFGIVLFRSGLKRFGSDHPAPSKPPEVTEVDTSNEIPPPPVAPRL